MVTLSIAAVLLSELDGAMEALQDGRCADVNVVPNFGMAQKTRGAVSSATVRHVSIVMSCQMIVKKPHGRTQLDGGANCAHGHNLLFEQKNINERVQNAFQR